jgi:hypothetical protein
MQGISWFTKRLLLHKKGFVKCHYSRQSLRAEVRFRARVSACEIYGRQNGSGTGVSPSSSVFPVYIIP